MKMNLIVPIGEIRFNFIDTNKKNMRDTKLICP